MKNPKYRPLYQNSYFKEIRRLAQGIPGLVEGTNTMFFIDKTDVPANRWRDVTYGQIVVDYRSYKTNPYRTILAVGGGVESQLYGRLRYTHSGVDHGEDSPQQYRLNTQCKINENLYKGFLFKHYDGSKQVHVPQTQQPLQECGAALQSGGEYHQRQICVCVD